jgi:two-component system, LytTR family, response regulator
MMRTVIVDDEIYAREELDSLLTETGEFTVVGKCGNALDAIKTIKEKKPEVLFLDIQMPVIDGFECLGMIDRDDMPHVVFVTAYDSYAIKAFDENAIDYLLKPVESERLGKTVQKLKRLVREGNRPVYKGPDIHRIPCIIVNRIKLISLADIEYVHSNQTGIYVSCPNGEFFTDLTLKVLEERTALVRCHKQYLINMDLVDEIILQENMLAEIKTKSGKRVPVSRRYLKLLKERLVF